MSFKTSLYYTPLFFYIVIYTCSFINPQIFPPLLINELFIFASLVTLPFVIGISFFINKKTGFLYLLMGLLYLPFYTSAITFSTKSNNPSDLKVLSFNASSFRSQSDTREEYHNPEKKKTSREMIEWVSNFDGDIMCFQEYYHDKREPMYSSTELFTEVGFNYHYVSAPDFDFDYYTHSLATFSKYPIVNMGDIFVDENRFNRGIFTDIALKTDTVRIINVHLHSNQFGRQRSPLGILKAYYFNSITRYEQTLLTIEYIKNSPYPTLLVGDLNQTICSYTYQDFNHLLNNAFEEKGNGFGSTLNGMIPFLRIDQQFCSDDWDVNSYKVRKEMTQSDHFPIECTYRLKR